MKILVEVPDNKAEHLLDVLKSFPYIKNAEIAEANTVTNFRLLESIESYETGKVKPAAISLDDLKKLLHAES